MRSIKKDQLEQTLEYERLIYPLIEQKNGLSKEEISRMNWRQKSPRSLIECSICTCSMSEGDTIRQLYCNHQFHQKCIDQWLAQSYSCPLCRANQKILSEQFYLEDWENVDNYI